MSSNHKHQGSQNYKTMGILGGMGPQATLQFCQHIIHFTPNTEVDQDHIPFILYNNPLIPDRTKAITQKTKSPKDMILQTALRLQEAHCDFLVMPCNTAHYFYRQVEKELKIPFLNMIELTSSWIQNNHPPGTKVGILGTTGTLETRLYQDCLSLYNLTSIIPTSTEQDSLVMEAIFSKKGIKSGHYKEPRKLLEKAAHALYNRGCQTIIMGCTEIPLVMEHSTERLDPMVLLAKTAIKTAMGS